MVKANDIRARKKTILEEERAIFHKSVYRNQRKKQERNKLVRKNKK
jgi:hypothetical protein